MVEKDFVEVTICTDCEYKRDNKLGLYCRLGTRRLKKIKKKGKIIVLSFDCDQPFKERIKVKKRK